MIYDFHSHTTLSDGELSPLEQIRRAVALGYRAIALTEHSGGGELPAILPILVRDCALAEQYWDIIAIPGVELTHLPPQAIAEVAARAKEAGAKLVIVHGETIVEPVERGTNEMAILAPDVDILAHPGLLTLEEARAAAAKGTFLELSARRGHSLTNGHVARVALLAGARLVLDSDAHAPQDLLTEPLARAIVLGAGLEDPASHQVLQTNPRQLLKKLHLLR